MKLLKTTGTTEELLKEDGGISEKTALIFITDKPGTSADDSNESSFIFGNVYKSDEKENTFALYIKENIESKINIPALRCALISLLKIMQDNELNTILMNRFQISSNKDENAFLCTLKEILYTTYPDLDNGDFTVIVSNYK